MTATHWQQWRSPFTGDGCSSRTVLLVTAYSEDPVSWLGLCLDCLLQRAVFLGRRTVHMSRRPQVVPTTVSQRTRVDGHVTQPLNEDECLESWRHHAARCVSGLSVLTCSPRHVDYARKDMRSPKQSPHTHPGCDLSRGTGLTAPALVKPRTRFMIFCADFHVVRSL